MSTLTLARTTALLAAGVAASLHAAPRHQDIVGPGGFMQSCAAPSSPGAPRTAGTDFTADFASGHCVLAYFTGNGTASSADAYSSGNISNASSGSVGIGHIHMQSSNTSPGNVLCHRSVEWGFEDRLTLNLPGQTGKTVYMLSVHECRWHCERQQPGRRQPDPGHGLYEHDRTQRQQPGLQPAIQTSRPTANAWPGAPAAGPTPAASSMGTGPSVCPWWWALPLTSASTRGPSPASVAMESISTLSSTALDFSHSVLVQGVSGILLDGNPSPAAIRWLRRAGSTGPSRWRCRSLAPGADAGRSGVAGPGRTPQKRAQRLLPGP